MLFGHLGHGEEQLRNQRSAGRAHPEPFQGSAPDQRHSSVAVVSVVSIPGRGCSRWSELAATKYLRGSASIPDDSRFTRKHYYDDNVPPQAALPPDRASTGCSNLSAPILHGSSIPQCTSWFDLLIRVHGSVPLTDGSLLGVPAESGF